MRKTIFLLIFSILALSLVSSQSYPSPKDKYVNDFAQVLDIDQQTYLQQLYYNVEQETTAEVTFVSLESINGSDISQYATELATEWKIGKADKDNGLLILYVKDINKIWVATGYGLEGILPDSKVGRFLDDYYVPARDSDNLSQGIIEFSNQVSQELVDNKEEIISGQAPYSELKYRFLSWLILIVIFIIISSILNRIARKGQNKGSGMGWFLLPLFLPSGRSSGFGGGGFGGGFGGGGFGGGGAGR